MLNELKQARDSFAKARQRPPSAALPPLGSSSFANHLWLLKALEVLALVGQRVIVFGSIDPRAECLCLAAGAAQVTTVDFNRLHFAHPLLSTITVSELSAAPKDSLGFDVRS